MNTSISQAAAIREVLGDVGPNVPTRDIIRRLKESRGIVVSPQQVSNEKAKLENRNINITVIDDLPVSVLKKVKLLVDELGSIDVVRRALDELDELSRPR